MRDLSRRTITAVVYAVVVLVAVFAPPPFFAAVLVFAAALGSLELVALRRAGISAILEGALLITGCVSLYFLRSLGDPSGSLLVTILAVWAADVTYIPDLAMVMPTQWNAIWGNTKKFPGPVPVNALLEHIEEVDWGTDHFWSDYNADASTQVVLRALQLRGEVEKLIDQTRGEPPDRFATRWRRFVTDVQNLI